ncbi:THC0290_0291 family protein [Nonlabens antarcticus]|uniref:THC0290_0291 family protein n=1 Tax=Nonlabens antarcticus TaxID=392714 RepID=UPI001890C3F0|nr:glutamate dehydrogenase [Nonlabens antarcticus]
MKTRLQLVLLLLISISCGLTSQAQFGFSHEIGVIAGPVAFQSDYGERNDFDTNKGNVGKGIGIIHYINFAYRADCNCYSRNTYWNDHFKIRSQLTYHVTNLDHLSPLADKNSIGGLQLRSMEGKAKVIELGAHLEYYPLSIRDFQNGGTPFAPYIALGAHYVNYKPEAQSSLGPLGDSTTTFPTFIDRIDTDRGSTVAYVADIGVRYKLTQLSDVLISSAWHYYDGNYVDGLSPNNVSNRNNDWIWWLNVGFIYYL